MTRNYVGYVTGLHARDQRYPSEPFLVEAYVPSEKAGKRLKRLHLASVSDDCELVMISVLRDALVHRLPVFMAVDDKKDRLAAVEIHLPARETYEEGGTERLSGRVRWLSVDEVPMGATERGQPDMVTVRLDGSTKPVYLILERRNSATKTAQLELLERAVRDDDVVTLEVRQYRIGPGSSVKVIVGVGVGTPPMVPLPPR